MRRWVRSRMPVDSRAAAERAMTNVGSMLDYVLSFWAQAYPHYTVRRVALFEMARRERLEAA